MAIDKKFIHFKTYDNFISHNGIGSEANITIPTEGSEDTGDAIYGQIKGSSVVFIKDVQKMWTHGQLYDCGGGGNMSEQDPVFMASPAATITEAKKTEWDNKVDKISGKQLSTEDFTTALKSKLESLNNYDDSELSNALATLRGDFDKLVSGDTTTAIKTFNEIIAFLDGIADTEDLAGIIASIEQQIASKADDSLVLHKAGDETITGVKTFNGRVNFLGSGDSNAMYLSTNTRLNVDGTTNTVLGFSSGTFLINNAAYNLTLRGKGTRPNYNNVTLALSSDIPAAVTESTVSG